MSTRITVTQVHQAYVEYNRLREQAGLSFATLHMGNSTHKIHNVLIADKSNLWPDGMGGTSTREAYNALRLMTASLGDVLDHQESTRFAQARSGQ